MQTRSSPFLALSRGLAVLFASALLITTFAASAAQPLFQQLLLTEDADILLEWGKRYLHGVLAPQEIDRAIELYCAAARLGSTEASYRLGEIYSRTLTGKTDEVLAAGWLTQASVAGSSSAARLLSQWDLTQVDVAVEPACVLSPAMIDRKVPRASPSATKTLIASQSKPLPAVKGPRSPARRDVERLVHEIAPTYRLNPALVLAVIQVESNFNAKAKSPKQAQGLMQLIPATAKRFGVADPWDPRQNLRGGMAYLRWLLDHFDGDLRLALAGYNAGENAVRKHGGVPPYKETRNYVRRVARALGISEAELGAVPTGVTAGTAQHRPSGPSPGWERRFFGPDTSG